MSKTDPFQRDQRTAHVTGQVTLAFPCPTCGRAGRAVLDLTDPTPVVDVLARLSDEADLHILTCEVQP